ncbi:MAG: iron-siderophore ABC transporter substrate-binding protein [Cyanobacteria bacterium J06626_18]
MGKPIRQRFVPLILASLLVSCQSAPMAPPSTADTGPTRPVEHAMGTTQVPASPERVVVLDYAPLDTALALGIEPVGTIAVFTSPTYPEVVESITVIGESNQPNLEAILQLQPDLILGARVGVGRWYRRLSQIAPTVLTQDNGRQGEWQANFRLYAAALGQAEQAEQLLTEYQQRVAALQSSLAESLPMLEVSVIGTWTGGVVAYSTHSFPGSVLQDVGFARNPAQGEGKRFGMRLSREDLTRMDGDVLFLVHHSAIEGSVSKTAFISDPLWSQLYAVEQGVVCEVDSATWTGGRSILAANQILTDVERCLNQEE